MKNYYREEPRPFEGRLPLVVGLPLPPDLPLLPNGLPRPVGRPSLLLEPAGFLASSLAYLLRPFAAPADFVDGFDFDEASARGFFRGALRDFLFE